MQFCHCNMNFIFQAWRSVKKMTGETPEYTPTKGNQEKTDRIIDIIDLIDIMDIIDIMDFMDIMDLIDR